MRGTLHFRYTVVEIRPLTVPGISIQYFWVSQSRDIIIAPSTRHHESVRRVK